MMSVGINKCQWPTPAPAISSICVSPTWDIMHAIWLIMSRWLVWKWGQLLNWLTTEALLGLQCRLCCQLQPPNELWCSSGASLSMWMVTGKWVEVSRATVINNDSTEACWQRSVKTVTKLQVTYVVSFVILCHVMYKFSTLTCLEQLSWHHL